MLRRLGLELIVQVLSVEIISDIVEVFTDNTKLVTDEMELVAQSHTLDVIVIFFSHCAVTIIPCGPTNPANSVLWSSMNAVSVRICLGAR